MTQERIITAEQSDEEVSIDRAIRPQLLKDYRGQPAVTEQLEIFIPAARARSEALDHLLFFGPPGLGKTTLAHIVANEMDATLHSTSGPVLERPGDLAAILTNLEPGQVLFIDLPVFINQVIQEEDVGCQGVCLIISQTLGGDMRHGSSHKVKDRGRVGPLLACGHHKQGIDVLNPDDAKRIHETE